MKFESGAKGGAADEGRDDENVTLESYDASGSVLCCDTPSQNEPSFKIRTDEMQEAIKTLKYFYKVGTMGLFSKEDFASALRGHQAALDATKSEKREEALSFLDRHGL